MYNLKEKLPGTFSPVQFGVGMPGGAENIVHGIRNLLSDHPDWVLVSLDLIYIGYVYVLRTARFHALKPAFMR